MNASTTSTPRASSVPKARFAPGLEPLLRPVESLTVDPNNARSHPDRNLDAIKESLARFGQQKPIVVAKNGVVLAGNGTLAAARALGWDRIAVVVTDLDGPDARGYALADNRTGELAEWDVAQLMRELDALPAELANAIGWDEAEMRRIAREADEALASFQQPGDEDDAPPPPATPRTERGDLWILGQHRLLCGDARNAGDLVRLCEGRVVEALWTDPPYGVEYRGGTGLTIEGDDAAGLDRLLDLAFAAIDRVLVPSARFYVAAPAGPQGTVFRNAIARVGWRLHQCLAWVKDSLVLGHSDYHYRHEDILYGWKPGEGRPGRGAHAGTRWQGGNDQDTVLEVPRPKRSEQHPTMKPVALVRRCLVNSTQRGDLVLDPFSGSGSTLLACEQLGRSCRAMDVDPRYVDVAVARWERLTGETARRECP